jgi:flagellar hook assembly protein FlgD
VWNRRSSSHLRIHQPSAVPLTFSSHTSNEYQAAGSDTHVPFELEQAGRVSLTVYDVQGRLVRRLVNGTRPAGRYEARWDGKDGSGRSIASGVYFYHLEASRSTATRQMVLLR